MVRVHARAAWTHPANSGHRISAVLRVLTFYVRGYVFHRRTLATVGTHSKMWADTRVTSTARVVLGDPPDWQAVQAWKRLLGPGALFVDVGANAGTYSLWAADLGATVIAVEPNRESRAQLEENAALNGYTFEIHPVALAAAPGVMRFTEGLGTMNHLLVDTSDEGVEVEVSTLDEILGDRKADGVKIDVEGAERLVLDGASKALAEGRLPVIQMEWNGMSEWTVRESRTALAELLGSNGYRLCRPDMQGRLQPFDANSQRVSSEDVFAVLDRD
jgi:FkbM family methyltransferase